MSESPEIASAAGSPVPSKESGVGSSSISSPIAKPVQYFASVEPGLDIPLADTFIPMAQAVLEFEKLTGRTAWLIIQSDTESEEMDDFTMPFAAAVIAAARNETIADEKLTVILHTSGGDPHAAYKLGTFFQKHNSEFHVLIPKRAKSSGTLFALSADRIVMGDMAELGPLDMQVMDVETEIWDSALNETKSLQTLSREALILYTAKMDLLRRMYRRKGFETRNRIATNFVNEMIKPLVDKLDTVHYTKMARIMEIMKKYGKEMMQRAGYAPMKLSRVVEALGEDFPDHSYIIDSKEARRLGLKIVAPRKEVAPLVETIADICGKSTIIGRISVSNQT